jgi:hypothetical protein
MKNFERRSWHLNSHQVVTRENDIFYVVCKKDKNIYAKIGVERDIFMFFTYDTKNDGFP